MSARIRSETHSAAIRASDGDECVGLKVHTSSFSRAAAAGRNDRDRCRSPIGWNGFRFHEMGIPDRSVQLPRDEVRCDRYEVE